MASKRVQELLDKEKAKVAQAPPAPPVEQPPEVGASLAADIVVDAPLASMPEASSLDELPRDLAEAILQEEMPTEDPRALLRHNDEWKAPEPPPYPELEPDPPYGPHVVVESTTISINGTLCSFKQGEILTDPFTIAELMRAKCALVPVQGVRIVTCPNCRFDVPVKD